MITDIALKIWKSDPLIKRNLLKTLSWRAIGSFDTVILSWIVTGNLHFGIKIGIVELFTKMLLYYAHERAWQSSCLGLNSKTEQKKKTKQENQAVLFKQTGNITREHREALNGNSSFTIWFTGLSGSGKSTLANELEQWLYNQGLRVYILDGDNTRLGINSDLTFSDEDREENIRRVAEICKLFNEAGIIVIASFISPFIKDRMMAKTLIGETNFIEVFADSTLDTCQARDIKGLYKLALTGKIKHFTGISSPYEPPLSPALHLSTENDSVDACLKTLIDHLIINRRINSYLAVTA